MVNISELSAGLSFDNLTGRISGVPVELSTRTLYTITATNDDGTATVLLNITVEDTVYDITTGPLYLLNNSAPIASLVPTSTITGSQFEIHPALPQGLFLGESNGTLWGAPTEVMGLTNFTIYANSSSLSDSFEIALEVLEDSDGDQQPDALPDGYTGELVEDLDDDGDGFSDIAESDCMTNSSGAVQHHRTWMVTVLVMHLMMTKMAMESKTFMKPKQESTIQPLIPVQILQIQILTVMEFVMVHRRQIRVFVLQAQMPSRTTLQFGMIPMAMVIQMKS